jgi:hypothetical protein
LTLTGALGISTSSQASHSRSTGEAVSKAIGSEIESKPARVYDPGLTGLPLAQRPGIVIPTPENLQAVADKAAAQRNRTMAEVTPQEFGAQFGIPRNFALFVQRLEARVLELERDNRDLRKRVIKLERPAHMRDVVADKGVGVKPPVSNKPETSADFVGA